MTVDEKGLQAAWNAYMRELREPWQDRVEAAITAYLSARSAEPVASAALEAVMRDAIAGGTGYAITRVAPSEIAHPTPEASDRKGSGE